MRTDQFLNLWNTLLALADWLGEGEVGVQLIDRHSAIENFYVASRPATLVFRNAIPNLLDRIAALEAEKKALQERSSRALVPLRQILGAVDGVMAKWGEGEGGAELVPTTIGQWAEVAIRELSASLPASLKE